MQSEKISLQIYRIGRHTYMTNSTE